jgi:hypothetical protein
MEQRDKNRMEKITLSGLDSNVPPMAHYLSPSKQKAKNRFHAAAMSVTTHYFSTLYQVTIVSPPPQVYASAMMLSIVGNKNVRV